MKTAAIILPTYNEAKNITPLIEKIFFINEQLKNWNLSVLVVDSSSPDQTAKKVQALQRRHSALHLLITKKEGLGKAYLKGFMYALKQLHADVVFEMDADLSHNPECIPQFLHKIEEGADFVIGSRYIQGGSIPRDWGVHRKLFSVLGNLIIRFGFMKLRITDWTSGYRGIRSWVVEKSLTQIERYSGYVFQVALLDEALKKGAKVLEEPINFVDREYGESKINAGQFIIQTLLYVFLHSSFIRYAIVGVTGSVIDFGLSYIFIEKIKLQIWLSTLMSTESAIISNFTLNNFWSFSHKRIQGRKRTYLSKFLHFNLISSGAIIIQTVGIHTFAVLFGPRLWFVYKFFILAFIIIPYSYILYNRVVWKEEK